MGQDVLPVACVTDRQQKTGLAMAIPPDFPCKFRFAYLPEPGCLELQFPLGLSSAATGMLKSRSPFRFLIIACDGHWGLRDGLRQYAALTGMVSAARPYLQRAVALRSGPPVSFDQVPDPENYAFWEGPKPSRTGRGEETQDRDVSLHHCRPARTYQSEKRTEEL